MIVVSVEYDEVFVFVFGVIEDIDDVVVFVLFLMEFDV